MIIEAKPLSMRLLKFFGYIARRVFKTLYNKLEISPVEVKPGHSYILMCNHFGFGDGFMAFYLATQVLLRTGNMKRLYIMSLKKQMERNWWLRYCGSFSVDPGRISVKESMAYAANVLAEPGNVLLFFPQGELESCHVRTIRFQEGISETVPLIKGKCQLLWSSNIIEYFESIKPSIYFNMLDCGTNDDFDFEVLQQQVNRHHRQAIMQRIRYTEEDS